MMTRDDVIDVLTGISSYDQRTVGEADVNAWGLAIGELDADDVKEAVVIHHKVSSERIKPAHITLLVRQIRNDRIERQSREERQAREDARDRRMGLAQGDSQLGGLPIVGADGDPVPGAYQVNDAIERDCETCGAEVYQACTNPRTGSMRKIPCLSRLKTPK